MFEQKVPIFIYCVSPVHMGAGTAIGVVDNPIQRERHTDYPMIAGSGLKGAVRHDFIARLPDGDKEGKEWVEEIFGPEPGARSDYAGAVSFSDAQIVAFPVRSAKRAFVYATSSTALARLKRLLRIVGLNPGWEVPGLPADLQALVSDGGCLDGGDLFLETFRFKAEPNESLKGVADWLQKNALPQDDGAFAYFCNKIKSDLVLLSDDDFGYFVRNATVVEPHVRIDDVTGTAEDGGLFYTENLPPEALLVGLIMTSRGRKKDGKIGNAGEVLKGVLKGRDSDKELQGIDGRMIQLGGDATTGRGQVVIKSV